MKVLKVPIESKLVERVKQVISINCLPLVILTLIAGPVGKIRPIDVYSEVMNEMNSETHS